MKTTLKDFPFKGKSTDYPRSDLKTALEWKEKFEAALREELAEAKRNIAPPGCFPNASTGIYITIKDILAEPLNENKAIKTEGQ